MRVMVEGHVQGVWFRDATREEALRLGVAGWVRNVPDGRVEAVFEGPPAAVAALLGWTRRGPEHAVVTHLEMSEEPPAATGGSACARDARGEGGGYEKGLPRDYMGGPHAYLGGRCSGPLLRLRPLAQGYLTVCSWPPRSNVTEMVSPGFLARKMA